MNKVKKNPGVQEFDPDIMAEDVEMDARGERRVCESEDA